MRSAAPRKMSTPAATLRPDGTTAVDVRALDDELGVAHGRLLSPEPVKKFAQSLHNLSLIHI